MKALAGTDLFNALFPGGDEAFESLRSLAATVKAEWDCKKVFDAVSTFISQPEMPTHTDYVRVLSLHKSKGLTADCVIVTGCVESALPKIDPDTTINDRGRVLEEQRRLMYVAMRFLVDLGHTPPLPSSARQSPEMPRPVFIHPEGSGRALGHVSHRRGYRRSTRVADDRDRTVGGREGADLWFDVSTYGFAPIALSPSRSTRTVLGAGGGAIFRWTTRIPPGPAFWRAFRRLGRTGAGLRSPP